jgi:hypothetical protein
MKQTSVDDLHHLHLTTKFSFILFSLREGSDEVNKQEVEDTAC